MSESKYRTSFYCLDPCCTYRGDVIERIPDQQQSPASPGPPHSECADPRSAPPSDGRASGMLGSAPGTKLESHSCVASAHRRT